MTRLAVAVLAMLAACSGGGSDPADAAPDLESAAVERGLVRDPADRDVTGLYARDTDRLCVVRRGGGAYRVGAFIDYGEGLNCAGRGSATRSGGTLSIKFKGRGVTCAFDARFDGDRISFPANLPEGCEKLCGPAVSLAALDVERLSESATEAAALRAGDGTRLCED